MKTFFMNDYGEGAHPIVMQRLLETNMEHTCGYGLDDYSLRAADVIREKCGQPGAAVHIMTGGTSANSIAIAAFLRPYEAAICAPTGHINVHETGAVEATGHKVLPCAAKDGKVTPEGVEAVCALHTDEHMVAPRLLYISQPTEIGTVYHLDELKALRRVCDAHGLILFVDGARLGSGLTSAECDVTLRDLAALEHDDYFAWARHANEMADIIRAGMERAGIPFFQRTTTNQIFAVLTEAQNAALALDFAYERWATLDDGRVAVRFVTSWATTAEDCEKLVSALEAVA